MSHQAASARKGPLNSLKLLPLAMLALCASVHADDLVTPDIKGVVTAGTKVELIKDGFKGTEGPLALPDGSLIFTETQANRLVHVGLDDSTSSYLEESNGANGLGVDHNGDIVAVQTLNPSVGVIYPKEHQKTYFNSYEGLSFARPNDIVVSKHGDIYFTDSGPNRPAAGANAAAAPTTQYAHPAVYRITPDGQLQRIADDIEKPNGIQLSPDEKVLYVANTNGEYVLAYDVAADGSVSGRRNFVKLDGITKNDSGVSSGADGLAVDAKGHLFVIDNVGIQVFNKKGDSLGTIPLPKKGQNLAFAGPNKQTLYVVGRGAVYKIAVLTPGFTGRAK